MVKQSQFKRKLAYLGIIFLGLALSGALLLTYAVYIVYPKLPALDSLFDYRPKIPLRIYSADDVLLGEFGEERRIVISIAALPLVMKQAILAAEDARFYQHEGIDYYGLARAVWSNIFSGYSSQGASTITMQVARNFFFTRKKTLRRKFYEALLAMKIEKHLTKDQILALYVNQIYLGQHAYGFANAARIYFDKNLSDITAAEAAMLAGIPKAPSAANPVANLERATFRQQYVLRRMRDLNFLTATEYQQALTAKLEIHKFKPFTNGHAGHVAEMVRHALYKKYQDDIYTQGLKVTTTILQQEQEDAYQAVKKNAFAYDQRHSYRGPEGFFPLGQKPQSKPNDIKALFAKYPDHEDLYAALVTESKQEKITAMLRDHRLIKLSLSNWVTTAGQKETTKKIRVGSVIRIKKNETGVWQVSQTPEVSSAFVALDNETGAVRALVGGINFSQNQFNNVTQAWRQPGSTFKPFIYSAALDKGFTPGTLVHDAPIRISSKVTGSGSAWEPRNYGNLTEGWITLRRALAKSSNLASIRIFQAIGPAYVRDYVARFGFDKQKIPPYLSSALGSGLATPLQMVQAYSVFATGGLFRPAYLIQKIEDQQGKILFEAQPVPAKRVLSESNAFMMDSMLREATRTGGSSVIARDLNQGSMAGKTGSTNRSVDAWFSGYFLQRTAVAWVGFDNNQRSLGKYETGARAALPIWMQWAVKTIDRFPPQTPPQPPKNLIQHHGDWTDIHKVTIQSLHDSDDSADESLFRLLSESFSAEEHEAFEEE